MSTDIIIPSWAFDGASLRMTEDCIDNILETTAAGERRLVLSHSGPLPRNSGRADLVIRADPPQGWAFAVNHALLATEAGGAHVVVGSIDVRVPGGWLPALLEAAGNDGIASPLDYKADGVTRRRWDATMRGSFWGAWYLFPRAILPMVGLLDGHRMRRMADMDWAIRARKAGYRTTRAGVRARHIAPHHVLRAHPDPHDAIVRAAFVGRHGADRLGSWEGLPPA